LPFLKATSIDHALEKLLNEEYDSAFAMKRIQIFRWYKGKPLNYRLDDVIRTQDIEPISVETSGFYTFPKKFIKENRRIGKKPWMQEVGLHETIDIDEEEDYELTKQMGGVNIWKRQAIL